MPDDNRDDTVGTNQDVLYQNPRYAVLTILIVVGLLLWLDIRRVWVITSIDESFTTTLVTVIGFIGTAYAAMLAKEMDDENGKIRRIEFILLGGMFVLYLLAFLDSFSLATDIETLYPLTFPLATIFLNLVGLFVNMIRTK